MAHPLQAKVAEVRQRARRLTALYALGWTVCLTVAVVLALGLADYWIRFQDPGIRLICSLTALVAFLWACYRYWYVGFGPSLSDVQLARRIERRFPSLSDRLTSAIEFLKQPEVDVQAGSVALRRVVIHQAAAAAESLDFSQVCEPRPTRRALLAGGMMLAIALVIALVAPNNTRIALARLAQPFGGEPWPKFYHVEFRNPPTRLAAGQPFEVELIRDADHVLPSEAKIVFRYESPDGGFNEEPESMQAINGTLVARKDAVSRPFWYRAEGGDDRDMEWIRLEVVEPPKAADLELILHPPAYSGLPVEPSERNVAALRGTTIALTGNATKKLRRATLRQESGPPIDLPLTEGGFRFALAADAAEPWLVDKSGPYWIDLEDAEGLHGGAEDRWEIRALADQVPTVTIEQPTSNIFVTARGEVPIRLTVKDDMAIHDVALHFSRSDRTDVQDFSLPLYQGPQRVVPHEEAGLLLGGNLAESRVVEHRWSLAELQLANGSQLTVWATAGDYLPQSGKSTVRRISVISPAELEERLAQRQTLIFGELQRVQKLQQDARAQTRSLDIQLNKVGKLTKPDVDQAQSAELNQRQVQRTLTSPSEGLPAQINDFLDELHNNRIDSPDLVRQMETIASELERLGSDHLGEIERELTGAIKAAQAGLNQPVAEPSSVEMQRQALAKVGTNQDQVLESLQRMLNELGQWDNYRRFAREIAQLQQAQNEIAQATKTLGEKTIGRESKELDLQQQADLKKLAAVQMELSRRLDKTQQQMAEMAKSLEATDPLSSATISDGLHQARQSGISEQMLQSSRQIEQNQMGQAAQQQNRIAKELEDLLATLSNRREQQLGRLAEQLRDSEQQLAKLAEQQAGLRKQFREVRESQASPEERKQRLERLARQQKQLEEETARLSRRLERLQAEQAGRSTAGAAGKMNQAQSAGRQGNESSAEEQAAQAEKDLEEAQQKLAERRREVEEDLAREQLARLEDSLKSLHQRQEKLIQETQRIENLRATEGRLSRARLSTVNELSRQQRALEVETGEMAERLALTEVLQLALTGAARQMNKAADSLGHRETGSTTQGLQESARQRLANLLTALAKSPNSKPGGEQGQEGAGQGGAKKGRSDGNHALAQLKLLRLLQEDLNQRYRAASSDAPGDTGARDLAEMAEEQGRLAELTMKLAAPPEENPEDDPEKLPDIRADEGPELMPEEAPPLPGTDVPPIDVAPPDAVEEPN